jgi:hypothetical protein
MISKLSDGDLMKIQQIYELPIMAVLNHVSYLSSGGNKR